MPPSPAAMRCSPGRDMRAESHARRRSFEGGVLFREKDDDLALFNEVESREKDNFLLQSNDDFDDLLSSKLKPFSDYKLGINIPARGESSDLLNAGDKNDYDWLITPPDTPLFPFLDDETPSVNPTQQRGRARSQPISISRSSTMETSTRSSRGSASPNRLSPSPRSNKSTFQSRGRPSVAMHSSPPSVARPASPIRRPSPPPSKPLSPAPRSSTPPNRRLSTGSSGPTVPSRVRGNSPVKSNRGTSSSPKIKAWQANIPGFPSEAPPNLRTSLADRPASYVRGSSPASRNGTKSGRQSMSPTASRSVCSSYSHDRDRFSSHSKGSVASSGDDDVDSLQSHPISSSDHSAPMSISTFSSNRGQSSPKKPSKTVTSASAPKRSFDTAIRQMDHRRSPQNMFRPLLSSVPSSTFYAGKSIAAHRSIVSRNSSITTSSNASSDIGTSGAHDTEGSEQNQEDITSEFEKAVPNVDLREEVFSLDKNETVTSNFVYRNPDKFPEGHDELDQLPTSNPEVVVDDASLVISVASDALHVRGDHMSDTVDHGVMAVCARCGSRYRFNEEIKDDLKLCVDCRNAEIDSVLTGLSEVIGGEKSQVVPTNFAGYGSTDPSAPFVAKPEIIVVSDRDNGESGNGCFSETSMHVIPEDMSIQHELEVASQQVENQTTVSTTNLDGKTADQDLKNASCYYTNPRADASEGAGISVLLSSSSGKGPIVRNRTLTATSITCDDFSYFRDSATSTRSSIGQGTASASSSIDLGSSRQTEGRYHRQVSSKKSDTENYKYEIYSKHQRSGSSLSGASTQGFQVLSFATSSHEEYFEVSGVHAEKDNHEGTHVALQELSLASESVEMDSVSIDIESDSNWRTTLELSGPTVNVQMGDTASVSNIEEESLPEHTEDLENSSRNNINAEVDAISHPGTITVEDDRLDATEAPNLISLDAISELESENDHDISPDSVFDIDSLNSISSVDDVHDSSLPESSSNDAAAAVRASISQDFVHSILEESSLQLEDHGGNHSRTLTLEEATDTILFCSSIVHNLAYEAANIAAEKEYSSAQLEGFKPVITPVGKSNPERKDSSRPRVTPKRNAKARQRRVETDSKPSPENTMMDEKSETVPGTTRLVGVPNKSDTMKPPKLESKCNCTIM